MARHIAREKPMNERTLFENWAEQKLAHNYHRLCEPFEVEYEFKRAAGYPSSYAFVRFSAVPADEMTLEFAVTWPAEFDDEYQLRIQNSIGEAIMDAMFSCDKYPFRGCRLTLSKFTWDEGGGSEMAVHQATARALTALRNEGHWSLVTGRYRSYVPESGV
jgi:hypothetical protein